MQPLRLLLGSRKESRVLPCPGHKLNFLQRSLIPRLYCRNRDGGVKGSDHPCWLQLEGEVRLPGGDVGRIPQQWAGEGRCSQAQALHGQTDDAEHCVHGLALPA